MGAGFTTTRLRTSAMVAGFAATAACASTAGTFSPQPAADRTLMPDPGPTPSYDFPDLHRRTLSNGLQLWVVERPGVPLVSMQLIVEAGAVMDPADRPGLASLTAAMLTEGTRTRTAEEIADELDFLAATLNANAGQEVAAVSLTTLARNLEPAVAIFADVVVNASFAEDEWDRIRAQRLAALRQALDQPSTVATQQFRRVLYGESHPFGRPVQGTPASVRATTAGVLRDFHRRHYVPNAANLIVVGAVTADQIATYLEQGFASWHPGPAITPAAPGDPAPRSGTLVYLIDKPDAAQSQLRVGHVGVERMHRDYFPLLLMNTILGGQFTSRINLNLREDKGYTYGARSTLEMGRLAGPFVASSGVHTAVTKESVAEIIKELTDIRGPRPVTAEELEFARTMLIRREPLTLETNSQLASRVQDLVLYGLSDDYFDHYNERIAAVTLEEVNRAAREYLQPQRFAIVIVGDQARIEASLRELPYPIEIVTVEMDEEPDEAAAEAGR